jgi:uncharacterized glyoxalase superfamily protein PhnB
VIENRSVPPVAVIPELAYADVREAVAWLSNAFGFRPRLLMGDHRAQLVFDNGALIVTERRGDGSDTATHAVLMRVEDADRHCEQARQAGARILDTPTDFPYGERQYNAEDIGGHRWTFSQSIADVDPASWGGEFVLDD